MDFLLICTTYIVSFLIVVFIIPSVVRVSEKKTLFEPHDLRKVHSGTISPLGGVALIIGLVISVTIFTGSFSFDELKYILTAAIMMFFTGLKDDLVNISARKKFLLQIVAGILLIIPGGVMITNLHGFLGLEDISYVSGILVSLFVMLSIINAFNLTDGIDGLASGLAILSSAALGSWFFTGGYVNYAILSFSLAGSLSGFFIFNVYGSKNKLFLGDSGSLVTGLVISILIIKFNELNINNSGFYSIETSPVVSFSIVICPLIDTLRVMVLRLYRGKSPFSPDRNHVHHRLLDLRPSHIFVTSIIIFVNSLLIIISFILISTGWNINLQFFLLFTIGVLYTFLPSFMMQISGKKKSVSLQSFFSAIHAHNFK